MGQKIRKPDVTTGLKIKASEDTVSYPLFDYPVFCLKHLNKRYHLNRCTKEEKQALIERLVLLSTKTWLEIQRADRHSFGQEKINRSSIIGAAVPGHVPKDVNLYALRFDKKKPMVGYKTNSIFHIIFLDRDFTLYNHG